MNFPGDDARQEQFLEVMSRVKDFREFVRASVQGAANENLDHIAAACIEDGIARGFDRAGASEIVGEVMVELVEASLYRWSRLGRRPYRGHEETGDLRP
jgi:hypothetical protein